MEKEAGEEAEGDEWLWSEDVHLSVVREPWQFRTAVDLGWGWELVAFEEVQSPGLWLLDFQLNGQGNMCLKTPGASFREMASCEKRLLRTEQERQAEGELEN